MDEQKKKSKRKILTRTLILAACILVIAAITVTIIFAVNDWGRSNIQIDSGTVDVNPPDDSGNQGNPGGTGDQDDDKPTSNPDTFESPLKSLDVSTTFDFGKDATLGHWHFHTGLDMMAEEGASVLACLDGTVEKVVTGDYLDCTQVTLSHANGIKTVYTFIDLKDGIKEGDKVTRGQVIGTVASAAGSEYKLGPHLHFEVYKNGELSDPTDFLNGSAK